MPRRRQEAGSRRQEAGGRKQEAGGRRQEAGGRAAALPLDVRKVFDLPKRENL
jgi:hypothetical protein